MTMSNATLTLHEVLEGDVDQVACMIRMDLQYHANVYVCAQDMLCAVESVLSSTGEKCFLSVTTTLLTFYVYYRNTFLSYAPMVIMTHD